jgi:hypothetical protein
MRLIVQHDIQLRGMDFKVAGVVDEAHLTKLIHEMTDTRACRTTDFRECFPADLRLAEYLSLNDTQKAAFQGVP